MCELILASVLFDFVLPHFARADLYLVGLVAARGIPVGMAVRAAAEDARIADHVQLLPLGIIRKPADDVRTDVTVVVVSLRADDSQR